MYPFRSGDADLPHGRQRQPSIAAAATDVGAAGLVKFESPFLVQIVLFVTYSFFRSQAWAGSSV